MLKKGGGIVFREAWKEFWRRQTIVITMDKLGVPRPIQDSVPWLRYLRDEYDKELAAEERAKEQALQAQAATPLGMVDALAAPPELVSVYKKYHCLCDDPLDCKWSRDLGPRDEETGQFISRHCLKCDFPGILREKDEIRGSRGIYRIGSWTGRRGIGRLYEAQLPDEQTVQIKEYLLPDLYFNHEEAERRKQAFVNLAGLTLADGRVQDFRLETPWEAISDRNEERCYLITKSYLDDAITLRAYLAQRGAMTGVQVRRVLNQVLQTLEFLHGQKFRLPAGQVQQGLAHGNINLDSLLISGIEAEPPLTVPRNLPEEKVKKTDLFSSLAPSNLLSLTTTPLPSTPNLGVATGNYPYISDSLAATSFFIHLCDLALWERLFYPPMAEIARVSPAQDLVALANVGFYLLAGRNIDPLTNQRLNPRNAEHWPPCDRALKEFILRLHQPDGFFSSAQEARLALLKLPSDEQQLNASLLLAEPDEEDRKLKKPRVLLFILGALGLLVLGVIIWSLLPKSQTSEIAQDESSRCCIKEVPAVPGGTFTYTGITGGTWTYVLQQVSSVLNGQTVEEKLQERQPKLDLKYKPEPVPEKAINEVRSGVVDFAIVNLINDLPDDLKYKEIAYDGLVVVVDFSYSKRENSLPTALNGQISFEQLRQLYTGKINNWKQLGGPNLPVKLYIPAETDTVQVFEQRVLKDKQQIDAFRNLWRKNNSSTSWTRTPQEHEIKLLETGEMLRRIRQDFEGNQPVGAIGFGTISKVFGQCAVYPLALIDDNKQPVQVLVEDNREPIAPKTDLCSKKGSYRPEIQVLKTERYPLGYPVVVAYLRDNSRSPIGEKFADMMRTQEIQQLLGKTGLVPLPEAKSNK